MNLHPAPHFVDLRRSGLSDEIILKASIESIPPDLIAKELGFNNPDIDSIYRIPYPGADGFCRYRVFYQDGKEGPKYVQRKGSGNRLYIPEKVRAVLQDVSIPLHFPEGEKKTLKACQEGLHCIGLSGLWNWSNGKKELIPDFDQVALKGRKVFIVPDSDWLNPNKHGYKKNLEKAVNELGQRLIERGAEVFAVLLPECEEKVGLDDYLVEHTVEEFQKLPVKEILPLEQRIEKATVEDLEQLQKEISQLPSASKREFLINLLSKRLKIGKRAIQKDVQTYTAKKVPRDHKSIPCANFQGLIDLVRDEEGGVSFLVKNGQSLQIISMWEVDGTEYVPPEKEHLPFLLPRAKEVLEYYQTDDNLLFEDILNYLKRFSYLPDNQWLIVAWSVFLTYLQDHSDIHYLPMTLFFAVPERGKSRTGKAVIYISFRGVHVVEVREANLFRYSQDLRATIFFDIMDLWKKAEKNSAEDILLLRYEKGAKVARVLYPEKGPFNDTVHYDVYGPTFIGTNETVHKILDSRCIPIIMPNKPDYYENPTPKLGAELKERLTAWRARALFEALPEIKPIKGLGGRLWDISEPLLQVCKFVNPESLEALTNALLEVANKRIEEKQDSIEGEVVRRRLWELSQSNLSDWTWSVPVLDLLEKINADRQENHKFTAQYLGKRLKAMSLTTRKIHGYSEIVLTKNEFKLLCDQYGVENIYEHTPVETLPLSTKRNSEKISNSYAGGELVESEKSLPDSLPEKVEENQAHWRVVESGRGIHKEKKTIIVILKFWIWKIPLLRLPNDLRSLGCH